jgi:formate dehydrogenase subunit gamma
MDHPTDKTKHYQIVASEVIGERRHLAGALLPILHGIQDRLGFIPGETVPQIAEALQLSRAEVHGVITYYHHFRSSPAGEVVIQMCRAEACQARGSEPLAAHASAALNCAFHATRADGRVTLEPVYCLGQCAVGPAIQVGDRLHARVTPQRFDAIVAQALGDSP